MKRVFVPETMADCVALAVKDWRGRRGYTQIQGAKQLEVSQPTFSRIERGIASLALDALLILPREDVEYIVSQALLYLKDIK